MSTTAPWVIAAIGRVESPAPIYPEQIPPRVFITGAGGSIGYELASILDRGDDLLAATDIEGFMTERCDVTNTDEVLDAVADHRPDLILHMAGAKHAPAGEEDPVHPFRVHAEGTMNVVRAASLVGARVVMASTCKACDPETAYGASKLIAERIALNAGHTVVRFYNVVETQGNVFETWLEAVNGGDAIEVTPCRRRFITFDEAVALTLWASARGVPPGRYMHWPTVARSMWAVAGDVWPDHPKERVPPRRGDRLAEPEFAASESSTLVAPSVARIYNPHDLEVKDV